MREPSNFFLNPAQQADVRRDQYFPATPSSGVGAWGLSAMDYRGNPYNVGPMENTFVVKVVANDDGDVTDSNDYYLVHRVDQWFGISGGDIVCEMRLDSSEMLEEGDECTAIMSGIVSDSPEDVDDGAILCVPVGAPANPSNSTRWIHVNESGESCGLAAYNGLKTTPTDCGGFLDSEFTIGSMGAQLIVNQTTVGNDETEAAWVVTFTVPPTFGTFTLILDGVGTSAIGWNNDPEMMLAYCDVTFEGAGTWTVTSQNTGNRTLEPGDFSTIEPLPQDVLTEANGVDIEASDDCEFYCYIVQQIGDKASISIDKTDAEPTASVPIGVSWLVTLANAIGGTFTLTLDDAVTDPIRFDASADDVETACNDAFDVEVSVTEAEDGWTITVVSDTDDHDLTAEKSLFSDRGFRFVIPPFRKIDVLVDVECVAGEIKKTYATIWTVTCNEFTAVE